MKKDWVCCSTPYLQDLVASRRRLVVAFEQRHCLERAKIVAKQYSDNDESAKAIIASFVVSRQLKPAKDARSPRIRARSKSLAGSNETLRGVAQAVERDKLAQ